MESEHSDICRLNFCNNCHCLGICTISAEYKNAGIYMAYTILTKI